MQAKYKIGWLIACTDDNSTTVHTGEIIGFGGERGASYYTIQDDSGHVVNIPMQHANNCAVVVSE